MNARPTRDDVWSVRAAQLVRVIGLLLMGYGITLGLERSVEPVWFGYSRLRGIAILAVSSIGVGLVSMSRQRAWSARLLCALLGFGGGWVACEVLLWWNPFLIPSVAWSTAMPRRMINRAMALDAHRAPHRRKLPFDLLTSNYLIDGYVRRLVPHLSGMLRTEDEEDRWVPVTVDEIGFRNPSGLYTSNEQIDVVLLGDSFTRGTSRVTVAEFMREFIGRSVYSLGDLGGAPQQWSLVFDQYGAMKQPRIIIANFFEGNDLDDAVRLQALMEQHRPLKELYAHSGRMSDRLVSQSVMLGLLYRYLLPKQRSPQSLVTLESGTVVRIPLDGYAPGLATSEAAQGQLQAGLQIIEHTLRRLHEVSVGSVVLSYIPSVSSVYADQADRVESVGGLSAWTDSPRRQRDLSALLRDIVERNGMVFVDVTPELRKMARKERLYGDAGHFNQQGYRCYSELLSWAIQPLLQEPTS